MGYFNIELMKSKITQEESIYIFTNCIQRIADNKEDRLYAGDSSYRPLFMENY